MADAALGPARRGPPRSTGLSALGFAALIALAALVAVSAGFVAPSPERLAAGLPRVADLLSRMTPPNLEAGFLTRVAWRLLETLQIALVGAAFGVVLSLPVAWLAARGVSPIGRAGWLVKALVSLFRTVPDLVWALIFVSAVGLGAVAGTMTIVVDTVGFCGRFFAEAMEDADKEPQEALEAIGAGRFAILTGAILPDAAPSLANTAVFAFEKAVRSSVVLGLVGAGGIGQELTTAFDLFQYRNAATIIVAVFLFVLAMEHLTDRLRARLQ